MEVLCAICRDGRALEKLPYVALPCGHVFHGNCVNLWFAEQAKLKNVITCPSCRCLTNEQRLLKLHIEISSPADESSATRNGIDAECLVPVLRNEIGDLKEKCRSLDLLLEQEKRTAVDLKQQVAALERKITKFKSTNSMMEFKFNIKQAELESAKKENIALQKTLEAVRTMNKLPNNENKVDEQKAIMEELGKSDLIDLLVIHRKDEVRLLAETAKQSRQLLAKDSEILRLEKELSSAKSSISVLEAAVEEQSKMFTSKCSAADVERPPCEEGPLDFDVFSASPDVHPFLKYSRLNGPKRPAPSLERVHLNEEFFDGRSSVDSLPKPRIYKKAFPIKRLRKHL